MENKYFKNTKKKKYVCMRIECIHCLIIITAVIALIVMKMKLNLFPKINLINVRLNGNFKYILNKSNLKNFIFFKHCI